LPYRFTRRPLDLGRAAREPPPLLVLVRAVLAALAFRRFRFAAAICFLDATLPPPLVDFLNTRFAAAWIRSRIDFDIRPFL
jgi:hypothetical protein